MKNFIARYFFSEYLAVPFSIFLIWLLLFGAPSINGRLIEPTIGGAFVVCCVFLFYIAIQGISALANVKEGHGKLRADVWISSIPFLVMAGIFAVWMVPETIAASWELPSWLHSLFASKPDEFTVYNMILSVLVVIIDVFMFGIYAGVLRSFINREKLAAAERRSTGEKLPVNAR